MKKARKESCEKVQVHLFTKDARRKVELMLFAHIMLGHTKPAEKMVAQVEIGTDIVSWYSNRPWSVRYDTYYLGHEIYVHLYQYLRFRAKLPRHCVRDIFTRSLGNFCKKPASVSSAAE